MKIDDKSLKSFIGLESTQPFECKSFGMVNSLVPDTIAFIDSEKFISPLEENSNITVVFTTKELASKIRSKLLILSDDPRYEYYLYYNQVAEANYFKTPSVISPSAEIHPTAVIAPYNVTIGEEVYIGPNVNVLPDVEIAEECIINSGVSIGNSGYEFKRTSRGILPVFHDGKVVIGKRTRIGANSAIDKGFSYRITKIGEDVKIDNLVYIAHGCHIGSGSFLVGHAMISGSTTVGKNVWVGPGAILSSSIIVGDGAYITIGSIVTRDVLPGERVTGNFAIPHDKFINNLKYIRE
jgi:UDP-3-O-[3-hydroxymyristoyl] glucosamine N-acyltransferase